MNEIIGVITSVEDDKDFNDKDYKKVTLGTGQELKVKYGREGKLKAKWDLLQEGVAIKFTMQDYTKPDGIKVPFVSDIETVSGALPGPTQPKILPEHQEAIGKAIAGTPTPKLSGQELGMWTNNLGNRIGDGSLDRDYPKTANKIKAQYYKRMFGALDIKIEKEN